MILNIQHVANWELIRARKQQLINKNNEMENKNRKPHQYQKGDKVMLRVGTENKLEVPWTGPYTITKVNTNGTVRLQIGAITDTINIRRLKPYHAASSSIHGGECNMRRSRKDRK